MVLWIDNHILANWDGASYETVPCVVCGSMSARWIRYPGGQPPTGVCARCEPLTINQQIDPVKQKALLDALQRDAQHRADERLRGMWTTLNDVSGQLREIAERFAEYRPLNAQMLEVSTQVHELSNAMQPLWRAWYDRERQ